MVYYSLVNNGTVGTINLSRLISYCLSVVSPKSHRILRTDALRTAYCESARIETTSKIIEYSLIERDDEWRLILLIYCMCKESKHTQMADVKQGVILLCVPEKANLASGSKRDC